MNDFFDCLALVIVAGGVFVTVAKMRARRSRSRRSEFLARFKASREGRRFHEDLKERNK